MKTRKLLIRSAIAVCALGCSSCALSGSNDAIDASQLDVDMRHAPRTKIDQSIEQQSEAIHSYLLGEIALQNRDATSAITHFAKAKELFQYPTPSLHASLATLYLDQGRLEPALGAITQALASEPNESEYLLFRASLLQALNRTQEAETAYKQFSLQEPKAVQGHLLLGVLYSLSHRDAEALAAYDRVLQIDSSNSLALYYRARALEQLGRLSEAQSAYEDTLRVEPKNSHAFLDLVRVLAMLGKVDEIQSRAAKIASTDRDHQTSRRVLMYLSLEEKTGRSPAERLKELTPNPISVADTRFRLAIDAIRAQEPMTALRELRLVLAEEPDNADARYNIAAVLSSTGSIESAVDELFKIKRSAPLYVKARTFAAFLLRQEKDYARAEQSLRDALSVEEKDSQILSFLVILLRESKKYDDARTIVERQLAAEPENDRLLFSYGTLLHDMKDDRSLEVMEKVVALNPENSDALNFVAFALAEQNRDLDRAEKLIARAIQIRPNDGYYLDTLGWIHFQRQEFGDAESVLGRAVQLTGEDPEILEHFGDALVKVGKSQDARSVYQRALEKIQDEGGDGHEELSARLEDKLSELTP